MCENCEFAFCPGTQDLWSGQKLVWKLCSHTPSLAPVMAIPARNGNPEATLSSARVFFATTKTNMADGPRGLDGIWSHALSQSSAL
jgi:hypothetical protein